MPDDETSGAAFLDWRMRQGTRSSPDAGLGKLAPRHGRGEGMRPD